MLKRIWIMNHYASNTFFEKGGRHYWFAKFLKEAGYAPVVFCCNAKHNAEGRYFETDALWTERMAEEIDVPFVFVKSRTYTGNGKLRVLNMVDFYRNVKKAAMEYTTNHGKPDVILASSVHPLTILAGEQLARRYGIRCVAEVRDLWPETIVAYSRRLSKTHPLIRLLYQGEKYLYTRADAIVFTMEGAYDYIRERHWEKEVPQSKVFYITNGVDLEQFDYNRECFRVDDPDLEATDTFKVVYTGSIRKVNNLGLLLDAAKSVTNTNIKFLIWGDGDEVNDLRRRVQYEKISNIVLKGKVEKKYVPSIVSQADLNIAHNQPMTIFRFGISFNKIFDYMAAGKPVLSDFPCPFNPTIQNGAGVSVDNLMPKDVAAAIDKMAELPEEAYQTYCSNARKAAKNYDFKNLTQRLLAVLEGCPIEEEI